MKYGVWSIYDSVVHDVPIPGQDTGISIRWGEGHNVDQAIPKGHFTPRGRPIPLEADCMEFQPFFGLEAGLNYTL
jgi:hypothetical protein